MRRALLALTLLAAPHAPAGDGVYYWRMQRGDAGERALASLALPGADETEARLLVAEVSREGGRPVVRRTDVADSPSLRGLRHPVTCVVRVNRHGGDFAADTAWRSAVIDELVCARDALRSAGTRVAEAQLDFDCPSARLRDYAGLLREARERLGREIRLSVTGMPSWLDAKDLTELLAAVDAWTLQVHLTELPGNAELGTRNSEQEGSAAHEKQGGDLRVPSSDFRVSLPPLCDTAKAHRWIARADALGRPFRIALPSYSYRVHFDAAGKFLGVENEQPKRFPGSVMARAWDPDTAAVAGLVRELRAAAPKHLTGLDWFRIPCDDDRFNLNAAAFAKLRRGEAPSPGKIALRVKRCDDGRTIDLSLSNEGELDADTPARVRADFGAVGRPLAYDLPGSRRVSESDAALVVAPPEARLRPGESRALGWMRFERPATDLSLQTVSP